jgi:hypothetical protein
MQPPKKFKWNRHEDTSEKVMNEETGEEEIRESFSTLKYRLENPNARDLRGTLTDISRGMALVMEVLEELKK